MRTLTIGFFGKHIRFIEINKYKEITFIDEIITDNEISEVLSIKDSDNPVIEEYSMQINEVLKKKTFHAEKVGVVLDSGNSFVYALPVDYDEDEGMAKRNIIWDFSNYFSEDYNNYKIVYYKMSGETPSDTVKNTLVIAFENSRLDLLRKIFYNFNMKIHLADYEHLSAEKCIREIYKNEFIENFSQLGLIIGVKNDRIDYSIIDLNNIYYYDFYTIKRANYKEPLMSLLAGINEKINTLKIYKVFLYGEDFVLPSRDLINSTNFFRHIPVVIANPFIALNFGANLKDYSGIEHEGYKFISVCGLSLKGSEKT